MSKELWRIVPGYGSVYKVSSDGRVLVSDCERTLLNGRKRKHKQKLIASNVVKRYRAVDLRHPDARLRETRKVYVHILVAAAFLPPRPSPAHEINHKNGIKCDCRVSNLEWVTLVGNVQHAWKAGLHNRRLVKFADMKLTIKQWGERNGLRADLIRKRLAKGYTISDALDVSGAFGRKRKSERMRQFNRMRTYCRNY